MEIERMPMVYERLGDYDGGATMAGARSQRTHINQSTEHLRFIITHMQCHPHNSRGAYLPKNSKLLMLLSALVNNNLAQPYVLLPLTQYRRFKIVKLASVHGFIRINS